MHQFAHMIMIGTQDISKIRAFYEDGLGWTPWMPPMPMAINYKVGTAVLVFLDAAYLAAERGEALSAGSKSSLAIFVSSKADVDALFERALAAGATASSPVRDRDGGLYTGYFADPDGNSWEVCWSPHNGFDASGALTLSPP